MTKRSGKVFVDSNMILYAAEFSKENVFNWITSLYEDVYIHIEVYCELLTTDVQTSVRKLIEGGSWTLFDPSDLKMLSEVEQLIYKERLKDVTKAFSRMNNQRIKDNKPLKSVSNIGEIGTIVACMMINAGIICSNDFDIRTVVEQEDYRVLIDEEDITIVQDSAADFCVYCYQTKIATRKNIRMFYKTIIVESANRDLQLLQLDNRFKKVEE